MVDFSLFFQWILGNNNEGQQALMLLGNGFCDGYQGDQSDELAWMARMGCPEWELRLEPMDP
jgi:hypothetical protein